MWISYRFLSFWADIKQTLLGDELGAQSEGGFQRLGEVQISFVQESSRHYETKCISACATVTDVTVTARFCGADDEREIKGKHVNM